MQNKGKPIFDPFASMPAREETSPLDGAILAASRNSYRVEKRCYTCGGEGETRSACVCLTCGGTGQLVAVKYASDLTPAELRSLPPKLRERAEAETIALLQRNAAARSNVGIETPREYLTRTIHFGSKGTFVGK